MAEPTHILSKLGTPGTKTQHARALQYQRLANKINQAAQDIQTVLGRPDLILALAPVGFNERELNHGLALATAAQTACSAHLQSLTVASSTQATRDLLFAVAKEEFSDFCEIVLKNFFNGDRTTLGANGAVPANFEKFCTHARNAYGAALKYPYLGVLASHDFALDRIDGAIESLDELTAIDRAGKSAEEEIKIATQSRATAVAALNPWISKFRKRSLALLKKHPDGLDLVRE